ncbi:MAG: hypothetical protein JSU74_05220, partial [Candidatus Zixiibacteriota bacterium]
VQNFEPLRQEYQKIISKSVGSAVRAFKAAVTAWCRRNDILDFRWQRGFYDHVVRSDAELSRIRTYISENSALWEEDIENPDTANHLTGSEEYYGRIYGSTL